MLRLSVKVKCCVFQCSPERGRPLPVWCSLMSWTPWLPAGGAAETLGESWTGRLRPVASLLHNANIQRYDTGQPLTEQLSSARGQTESRINGGKLKTHSLVELFVQLSHNKPFLFSSFSTAVYFYSLYFVDRRLYPPVPL